MKKLIESKGSRETRVSAICNLGDIYLSEWESAESKCNLKQTEWKLKQVKRIFKKGVELNSEYSIEVLGDIYLSEEDIENAKIIFEKGVELENEYSIEALGDIYEKEGNIEKAIRIYKKGVKLGNEYSKERLYMINDYI